MGVPQEVLLAINVLLVLVGFFGSIVINEQRRELRELRGLHKDHGDRFASLPLEYVLRDDFRDFQKAIFSKLDRIENKLDGKEDKG